MLNEKLSNKLSIEEISALVQTVPDFPKEGIQYKDITPILEDHRAFQSLIIHLAETIPSEATKMVAIESRGFIFGAALAQHLDLGLVLARKPGKLPRETVSESYDLEYGSATLEIHKSALNSEDRVVVIDDVIATGGTAHAVEQLCAKMGAPILGHRFIVELVGLEGGSKLTHPLISLIQY